MGFVDGSIEKTDITVDNYKAWDRCNSMMVSWLLGVLEQDIGRSVLHFQTSQENWANLEERFGQASGTTLLALQQSLQEIKQGTDNISVDDFSRYMWVYHLKSKYEALKSFKKFRMLVENESEEKVKVFGKDRGGEFTSAEFKEYCEGAGIDRHYTTPYTPQQNGVVERRNGTVVEMARSCLKEMKMPAKLWGKLLEIPYDRSKRVVNLGREPGTKGYHLYDPESNRVHTSRDVIFEESKPWIWGQSASKDDTSMQFSVLNIHEPTGEDHVDHDDQDGTGEAETHDSETHDTDYTGGTPASHSSERANSDNYDDSTEPKRFRSISDIYSEMEEVELEEEFLLMGVDEPMNYKQAVCDSNWRRAMKQEMDSIEKNGTWE
ncbi:hypothetical protein AgCh_020662 [Apium graveolens]